jgi:hypothetical protein
MVNPAEYRDRLIEKNKYRVVTRYEDATGVFIGIGAIGSERNDPVFSFNGVTMMLPWQGIERLEPAE